MKRPSSSASRNSIAVLCYVLIVVAWVIDLFTPQLFVAAILLNGPIALSGLALSTRVTAGLVIFAEIANIVSGYVNGVQAHNHWDTIAIGDRLLSAASFLLVGYLTARAQEYAREAGSSAERARIASEEKALRRALEAIRATLNLDIVQRAIVREAVALTGGDHAMLVVQRSQLDLPDVYCMKRGSPDTDLQRVALDSPLASLVAAASENARLSTLEQGDPIAHMVLESQNAAAMASVRIAISDGSAVLLVFAEGFARSTTRVLQAFGEGASVALAQAWLFMQLGFRNEQIAKQKAALEDRSRVIRDIVYALAHDLRTPLSAANATMQQALDGAYGEIPEPYREVLRTSLASNADLRRLLETLLMVARFESGESSTLREAVDVGDELQRVAQELQPIADVKGVTLRASSNGVQDKEGPLVLADPSEIRRAISNLTANAIEASPQGSSVQLRTERDGDCVRLVVEDEGYGVPEERRGLLFARFAPSSSRALGGGTGLGLYIVRLIAEKAGGSVAYAPREPRGSRFTLTLPIARA